MKPGPQEEWVVCHTKPRCEKKFARLMEAEGFAHYLPLMASSRKYGRETKRFEKPLFPGYVFTRVPQDRRGRLYQQDLLVRLIAVEDEATFLRQLDDVRTVVASGFELTVLPLLTRGRRVKIVGGPLHGLEGFIDNPERPTGIIVATDVLQQGLLVRVPIENLQPLP